MKTIKINDITFILGDCEEYLKTVKDNTFDLAIVDPPYGISISSNPIRQKHKKKSWDDNIPSKLYFNLLNNSSKDSIIWGGNYFIEYLKNTQGFIIWDKKQPEGLTLSMCEFAYTTIQRPAKIFRQSVHKEKNKIHPTQKPVKLYEWLLMNYAKEGDKILDTHLGSGSIALACHNLKFDLTACELDKDYFDAAMKRINNHTKQQRLF